MANNNKVFVIGDMNSPLNNVIRALNFPISAHREKYMCFIKEKTTLFMKINTLIKKLVFGIKRSYR